MGTIRHHIQLVEAIVYELSKPEEVDTFRNDPHLAAPRDWVVTDRWAMAVTEILKHKGFVPVGRGAASMVFKHPNYPWMLKIFNRDDGYAKWVAFCRKHPDNPYCPKFRGSPIKLSGYTYGIRVEPLTECTEADYEECLNILDHIELPTPGLIEDDHLTAIREFLRDATSDKIRLDLHIGNFMRRGKQIVISDPLYQTSL